MYALQFRHGYKSVFQFSIFSLEVLKDEKFLNFPGIRFSIFGYIFNSFFIVGMKRLSLYKVSLRKKKSLIIARDTSFTKLYISLVRCSRFVWCLAFFI